MAKQEKEEEKYPTSVSIDSKVSSSYRTALLNLSKEEHNELNELSSILSLTREEETYLLSIWRSSAQSMRKTHFLLVPRKRVTRKDL